jgi:hypothetical protein
VPEGPRKVLEGSVIATVSRAWVPGKWTPSWLVLAHTALLTPKQASVRGWCWPDSEAVAGRALLGPPGGGLVASLHSPLSCIVP